MQTNLFRLSELEALTTGRVKYYYNEKGETYPVQLLVCDKRIFRNPLFEPERPEKVYSQDLHQNKDILEEKTNSCSNITNECSLNRAKRAIYDIIRCNHFTHFCTLTFDGSIVERDNYAAVVRRFSQWCDNRVRRKELTYCGVIERHKESNGLHFHICTNDVLVFVDSGTVKCRGRKKPIKIATADRYGVPEADRKTVYNIPEWSYGFSTAIEITEDPTGAKVAAYLKKYLTKDFEKIGGRYYYSGGALRRPLYKYVDADLSESECDFEFSVGGSVYRGLSLEKNLT